MKTFDKIYEVILVDDQESYFKSQQDTAYSDFGLRLNWRETWEEAIVTLEEEFKSFDALIVDAKGRLDKDGKSNNIQQATTAIRDLDGLKAKKKYIPYAINSGYNVTDLLPTDTPFFQKGKEDALFSFIRKEIEKRTITKIKVEHEKLFGLLDKGYLEDRTVEQIIKTLTLFEKESYEEIDYADLLFNPSRSILEGIYKKLNEFDNKVIPDEAIVGPEKKISLYKCKERLALGKPYFDNKGIEICKKMDPILPYHLKNLLFMLHDVTSAKSHDYESYKSKYMIRVVINAVLEIVLWYHTYIDEH